MKISTKACLTSTFFMLLLQILSISLPAKAQEVANLIASDGAMNDRFGHSVSIHLGRAVVGAPGGNEAGVKTGAAYIFEQQIDGSWLEVAKLLGSNTAMGSNFGSAVALWEDRVLVGAFGDRSSGSRTGAAYVFERQGNGSWIEVAKLTANDGEQVDRFGHAVSMESDKVLIGAPGDDDNGTDGGAAYLFERQHDGAWLQVAKLLSNEGPGGAMMGASVSLSQSLPLAGAVLGRDESGPNSGSVHAFTQFNIGTWEEWFKRTPVDGEEDDLFGTSVSLWQDAFIVGAPGDDDLGSASGSAYIYEESTGWQLVAKLNPIGGSEDDFFGKSVSIFDTKALVGLPGRADDNERGEGSVRVFERQLNGDWIETLLLQASDGAERNGFGGSISMWGNYAIVGADMAEQNGVASGAAYIYDLDTPRIAAFTLIDAEKDLPIAAFDPLRTDAVINLDDLAIHLNIRAHTTGNVESVRFEFEGNNNFRTESIAPYALFGDTDGDFSNGSLQPGSYTLKATPYTEDFGQGSAGESRTIHFTVIGTVPSGLTLWNTLGTDEEVLHSKIGPNLRFYTGNGGIEVVGDAGYVAGVFGQGVTLIGDYSTFERVHNIVLDNANDHLDTEQGTVEVWYKQNVDPVANLHNIWRVFGGGFGLGSGMAFQSFDGDFDDRQRFSFQLAFGGTSSQVYSLDTGFDGYSISPYNGEWIHLAGVWDRNGINGGDHTMQLYLNGELVAASTESGWGTTIGDQVEICGANDDSAGLFAMDNLKLWNYAKTDFTDRFMERSGSATQSEIPSKQSSSLFQEDSELPLQTSLEPNYPNPFNPATTFQFSLATSGYVKLTVHDMLGREVRTLVDSNRSAGTYEVAFDAGTLPSGMYVYRLETPTRRLVRQMLLIK